MSLKDQIALGFSAVASAMNAKASKTYVDAQIGIHDGAIVPGDHNALAWTIDPIVTATIIPTAGSVYAQRFRAATSGACTKIVMHCTALTTTATAIYVGIYAMDGTQLAVSADVKSLFTTTGTKTLPISTVNLVAGTQYVMTFLAVTASPTITASIGSSQPSMNQTLGASTPLRQMKSTSTTRVSLAAPEVWLANYNVVGNGPVALMTI